nr:MAG TPA: hypothetical protein [Caudoviricetes sp.]
MRSIGPLPDNNHFKSIISEYSDIEKRRKKS